LLAATTVWGQLEPVSVAVGQTVRLNVTARPPDSCVAQLGFSDRAGNPVGPSSSVSLEPGKSAYLYLPASAVVSKPAERVEIQPRLIPARGGAASACRAVLAIDSEKKEAEEPENEAQPNRAKPAGGTGEGIKVHGHWIIDVRNPDGTLATHREFENSLQPSGAVALSSSLGRTSVTGLWQVAFLGPSSPGICNSGPNCTIVESAEIVAATDSRNLTVSLPIAPNSGELILYGSVTAVRSGTVQLVETLLDVCAVGVAPTACNYTNLSNPAQGPAAITLASGLNIAITGGQLVQVTVVLSFS
jgi:hypothetical protein